MDRYRISGFCSAPVIPQPIAPEVPMGKRFAARLLPLALFITVPFVLILFASLRSGPVNAASGGGFVEEFTGSPSTPTPWNPPNWDVLVHDASRPWSDQQIQPMPAMHGPDCSGPPNTHTVSSYNDTVYQCKDHLMTALFEPGYAVTALTPNQQVDFSQNATIAWDMSTLRTSSRDWVDFWITPFDDNLPTPDFNWLQQLQGTPKRSIHIYQNDDNTFSVDIINNFTATTYPGIFNTSYDTVLTEDAARRDHFELKLTPNHITFAMPAYGLTMIDTTIPTLDWTRGIVQLEHHSYNPQKDCNNMPAAIGAICKPNTWHWDNFTINPAIAFTMDKATTRYADANHNTITLTTPAPPNAKLRFIAQATTATPIETSYDNGTTWQPAQRQHTERLTEENAQPYWTPIPTGTTTIKFRGTNWYAGPWSITNPTIWTDNTPPTTPPIPTTPTTTTPPPTSRPSATTSTTPPTTPPPTSRPPTTTSTTPPTTPPTTRPPAPTTTTSPRTTPTTTRPRRRPVSKVAPTTLPMVIFDEPPTTLPVVVFG